MEKIKFIDNDGVFKIEKPENYNYLYFPLAGDNGIKSSITPNGGGDIKINQDAFLLEPVSSENLHNNRSGRNFWCVLENEGCWSIFGASAEAELNKFTALQDESELTGGFMWQTLKRKSNKYKLESKVTSFVPLDNNVELMHVEITNVGEESKEITPIAAIPIYGKSADNIRDHRHVTSLLNQIETTPNGVVVKPTMSFDERGHKQNKLSYFVLGITGDGKNPESFYPIVDEFIGEGGTFTHPKAVVQGLKGVKENSKYFGKDAIGGICFEKVILQPKEKFDCVIIMGITEKSDFQYLLNTYSTREAVEKSLEDLKKYWQEKVNIRFYTGDDKFDNYMRWINFQPFLRRIYGCSFLPHHDYGRGGRGWRDLWQDCLSLLIMDPGDVREMILNNYCGVRIDGTNATIIGEKQGEFIADRNSIQRVWMDHGVWPFLTTKLYIDQTGDLEILMEEVGYFKDGIVERGQAGDELYTFEYGNKQKNTDDEVYTGTVLEHLLLQHLCAYYEVGEHNHIRLRGADWNDALDMADKYGESVAFSCAYAGNLQEIAELLKNLRDKKGYKNIVILEEMKELLYDLSESIEDKRKVLADYLKMCKHNISGKRVEVLINDVISNLENKSKWIKEHIRNTEWINGNDEGWFNSYYDNSKEKVEGYFKQGVRMMLTGQVFAIMSETATKDQVSYICKTADKYLYDEKVGGYRLNTNFNEMKFDLGRMFGFAYGEKENGAVFSHMTVMYANALYKRGFIREGYKALQTLADTAMDFETSKIYPGIPEYFNGEGRGMYHYLTGAASWHMLTMVTEVYGVCGKAGDLLIKPQLVSQQFDEEGKASIKIEFAGKKLEVVYINSKKMDYCDYKITNVEFTGKELPLENEKWIVIDRKEIEAINKENNVIKVTLG